MPKPGRIGWLVLTGLIAAGCNTSPTGNDSAGEPAFPTHGIYADGVAFQLSDYRGKAVMLDFWGNW